MIRILHVVHAITRGGGLSNFVMNYYRHINREKVQFDFLYFRQVENDFKDEIESLGGRCFCMSEPSLSLSFFKERESFFKDHQGEWMFLHCHALFSVSLFAKTARKYNVKSVIAHSHNVGYGEGSAIKKIRNYFFVQQANKLSDIRLACSHEAAEFMFGDDAIKLGKAIVINNAIDCNKFIFNLKARNKVREELKIDSKAIVMGHVGGFTLQKNHTFLIDIFFEFQKQIPNANLLLVGGDGIAAGSTKKIVQDKVNQYNIEEKVVFGGLRKDVNDLLSAMDIFVFPSLFEGLGLVLIEAQAAGLQCVASDVVPNEAKVTDNLTFLPLEASAQEWASNITLSYNRNKERYANLNLFKLYDVNEASKVLLNIYNTINVTNNVC